MKIETVEELSLEPHPNCLFTKQKFKKFMMMTPRIFYERVIIIDDVENSTVYVHTTSLPSDKIDEVSKNDTVADNLISIQIYKYEGEEK